LTRDLARRHETSVPTAAANFVHDTAQRSGGCELVFPGAGHTRDNIVAWLPHHQVLFGGCFLKSVTGADLGNPVVPAWADSLRRARTRYPDAQITVPGHGTIAGDPAAHTLALLAEQQSAAHFKIHSCLLS
jgi:glyoxylase-like metal-dependent hydrolase (beta-lactamase superfamily II)